MGNVQGIQAQGGADRPNLRTRHHSSSKFYDSESVSSSTSSFNNSTTDSTSASEHSTEWPAQFEIPFDELVLVERVGTHGWDSMDMPVFRAEYNNTQVIVTKFELDSVVQEDLSFEDLRNILSAVISLSQHENIVSVLGASTTSPQMALVCEWCHDTSLHDFLFKKEDPAQGTAAPTKKSFLDKLQLCLEIATALRHLHASNVIHSDLSAKSVFLFSKDPGSSYSQPTLGHIQAKLGLNGMLLPNMRSTSARSVYLSPETVNKNETGKPSDVYSFGVVCWEILSEMPAFANASNRSQVHLQVAKDPNFRPTLAANELGALDATKQQFLDLIRDCLEHDPSQRPTFSDITLLITDLMDQIKNPLYVSHFGFTQRKRHRAVFSIDRSEIFGRDIEIASLVDMFYKSANVKSSSSQVRVLMLSGVSGIGKTAFVRRLVHSLSAVVNADQFSFLSGNFEHVDRGSNERSFSSITKAIDQFIQTKILLPGETNPRLLKRWRSAIAKPLTRNGQLMVDLFPSLEQLIGPQKPVPPLPPFDSGVRFWGTFTAFMQTIATSSHKILLFMDDMQWCDDLSLKFLSKMLSNPYVFLIGAFRDNEVPADHALQQFIADVSRSITKVHSLNLGSPTLRDLNKVCARTLRALSEEQTLQLSEFIYSHVNGNPHIFVQYFSNLEKEHLIRFDPARSEWVWDVAEIKKASPAFSADIVALMLSRLRQLSLKSQAILQLASCLGSEFELQFLRLAAATIPVSQEPGKPATVIGNLTESDLAECLAESLIHVTKRQPSQVSGKQSTPRIWFSFSHERVHQAAHALWRNWAQEKPRINLAIGRILKKHNSSLSADSTVVFEIATRLNDGSSLINGKEELIQLVDLNIQAAIQSEKAVMFDNALAFIHAAERLLFVRLNNALRGESSTVPSDDGTSTFTVEDIAPIFADSKTYRAGIKLSALAQRLEYAISNSSEKGDLHFEIIRKYFHRGTGEDNMLLAWAYLSRSDHLTACMKPGEAFNVLVSYFENETSQHRAKIISGYRTVNDVIVEQLYRRTKAQFESLDYDQIASLKFCSTDFESTDPDLMVIIHLIVTTWICQPSSLVAYVAFSAFGEFLFRTKSSTTTASPNFPPSFILAVAALTMNVVVRFEDHDMARKLGLAVQRHPELYQQYQALQTWTYAVSDLIWPLKDLSDCFFKQCLSLDLAQGDLVFAGHTILSGLCVAYLSGRSIQSLLKIVRSLTSKLESYPKSGAEYAWLILRSASVLHYPLEGTTIDTKLEESVFSQAATSPVMMNFYCTTMSWSCFLLGEFDQSFKYIQHCVASVKATGQPTRDLSIHCVLETLTMGRTSSVAKAEIIKALDERILPALRKAFVNGHAENYGAHYHLVLAERARIGAEPKKEEVISLYQKSIDFARRNELLVNELLAQEALMHYYREIGLQDLARETALQAFDNYVLLGATKKLSMMRADPQLRAAITEKETRERRSSSINLLKACTTGDIRTFKQILYSDPNPAEIVRCRDINDQSTPLHRAASSSSPNAIKIIKSLLKRGAPVQCVDKYHSSPVHCAASSDNTKALSLMLLTLQREQQQLEASKSRTGTSDEIKMLLTSRDVWGNAPLHLALKRDHQASSHFETANYLLLYGGDPNLKQANGDTPLHLACDGSIERSSLVEFLLSQPNIKLNIKDRNGDTPLLRAVRNGHLGETELILKAVVKSDANALAEHVDAKGSNLLHIAASRDDVQLLKLVHQYAKSTVMASAAPAPSALASKQVQSQQQQLQQRGGDNSMPMWLKMLVHDHDSTHQRTPIHTALLSKSTQFLDTLRELLHPSTVKSQTPLLTPSIKQDLLTTCDANGDTLLHCSLEEGRAIQFAQWLFRVCVVAGHGPGRVGSAASEKTMAVKNQQGRSPADICRQLNINWSTNWV